MNTEGNRICSNQLAVKERRQDEKKVGIVEYGIRIQKDYGYVRAAKYLYQNGISWQVIQRVLNSPHRRRYVAGMEKNSFLH
ncbi:MAG: hypothetical protein NC112_07710 [Oxalobacter formigenes]|nr:hypothetical protein [Oxalobacter formigenes]